MKIVRQITVFDAADIGAESAFCQRFSRPLVIGVTSAANQNNSSQRLPRGSEYDRPVCTADGFTCLLTQSTGCWTPAHM